MKSFFSKLFLLITVLVMGSTHSFAQYNWEKYPGNPLNIHGSPGSWNQSVTVPCVIFNSDLNRYEMWFTAFTGATPNPGIGFTYSSDGITWSSPTLVMTPGPASWESLFVGGVSVTKEGSLYKMWYTGALPLQIGYATSSDGGVNWSKHGDPVLSPGTGWESGGVAYPSVIKVPGGYWMFYSGEVSGGVTRTGRAFSTDGINWQKDTANNPVLLAGGSGQWDQNNFLARVIEMNDSLYMCYTAEAVPGNNSTSAIGFAKSADMGITWLKDPGNPIITQGTPGSWDYGRIEMGSILFKDDTLKIYYDGSSSATGNMGRIGLATTPFIVPVELTSFAAFANNGIVELNWSTATELNNQGFEVERSEDNISFNKIGFVPGFGTTTEPKSYSYSDQSVNNGTFYYRLKQVDFDGSYEYSDIVEVNLNVPTEFSLQQNYPNPFNPNTTIKYSIPQASQVQIKVFDILGAEISILMDEEKSVGSYDLTWNAENLPSGIYFYQLKAGSYIETKKMLLLK
jgi:hypothetical protein